MKLDINWGNFQAKHSKGVWFLLTAYSKMWKERDKEGSVKHKGIKAWN